FLVVTITKAERKQREQELRRKDIVDAAEKLFFAEGYEKVHMNDIAQEAEMARGTLYQYFKNKDDIYAAIALRAALMIKEKFQNLLSKDTTGIEKIRRICRFYYDFYKEYPGYYDAYYHSGMFEIDGSKALKEMQKIRKISFQGAVDAVKDGIKDGSLREGIDPVVTTLYMLATANNVNNISPVTQMYMDEYGLTHDDLFNQTLDMSIRAIENKEPENSDEL
ncbi:MAG: TetR/AcrR family transcriptional regulator, partial [Methanobacterium sp.]|nr:TetR/AcrR family transcriptional regulator [Methanobacterium sp.]